MAGSFETASENRAGFSLLHMEAMVYCAGKFSGDTSVAQNIKGGWAITLPPHDRIAALILSAGTAISSASLFWQQLAD
jgi:hypothetical protein